MPLTNLKSLLLSRLVKKDEKDFPEPDIAINFYANQPESQKINIYNLKRTASGEVIVDLLTTENRTFSYTIPSLMPNQHITVHITDFTDENNEAFEGTPDGAVATSGFGREEFLYLDKVFRKVV